MIENLIKHFANYYGKRPEFIVRAPGRINLIGEHTDYNGGLILPAAINKNMYFAFSTNSTTNGTILAKDLDQKVSIDLVDLSRNNYVWANYIIGLLIEFRTKGFELKGFNCAFTSDIPIGAGMSSSAALECGFALGMDYMIKSNLDRWSLVDMSHHSNHNFMNIYGGIMDQFSSLFGKEDQCMLMNCRDRNFEYHELKLEKYSIVIINSKVQHEHTTSGYNDRSAECKEIEKRLENIDPSLNKISDASIDIIKDFGGQWPQHLKDRAIFVLNENERVRKFEKAMKSGNLMACGQLLYQSHDGLQNRFEVSCPELDILVDLTRKHELILGARMMGGGFGGCTINLMKAEYANTLCDEIAEDYYRTVGIYPEVYSVQISNGAEVHGGLNYLCT